MTCQLFCTRINPKTDYSGYAQQKSQEYTFSPGHFAPHSFHLKSSLPIYVPHFIAKSSIDKLD